MGKMTTGSVECLWLLSASVIESWITSEEQSRVQYHRDEATTQVPRFDEHHLPAFNMIRREAQENSVHPCITATDFTNQAHFFIRAPIRNQCNRQKSPQWAGLQQGCSYIHDSTVMLTEGFSVYFEQGNCQTMLDQSWESQCYNSGAYITTMPPA